MRSGSLHRLGMLLKLRQLAMRRAMIGEEIEEAARLQAQVQHRERLRTAAQLQAQAQRGHLPAAGALPREVTAPAARDVGPGNGAARTADDQRAVLDRARGLVAETNK